MSNLVTAFGLIAGPLALVFVFWCLLAEIGRARDLLADADIERIEAGFAAWTAPTSPTPLRAVVIDIPPPDWDAVLREARAWNWAVATFNRIVAVSNEYDELVAA